MFIHLWLCFCALLYWYGTRPPWFRSFETLHGGREPTVGPTKLAFQNVTLAEVMNWLACQPRRLVTGRTTIPHQTTTAAAVVVTTTPTPPSSAGVCGGRGQRGVVGRPSYVRGRGALLFAPVASRPRSCCVRCSCAAAAAAAAYSAASIQLRVPLLELHVATYCRPGPGIKQLDGPRWARSRPDLGPVHCLVFGALFGAQ